MVVWDRKKLKPELTVGEVPGTLYGLSRKGWIDQELFDAWFNSLFLKYAPLTRPIFLLMDGHSSHYCPDTVRMAPSHKVIMFALPPNTTHLTQPLDKGCFGPLKMHWRHVYQFMVDNPLKVNRFNFSKLFHSAWVSAMTSKNIMAGFKTTGVYPTDRKAILLPGAFKSSRPTLGERSGLKYIPLYDPSHSVSSPGKEVHFSDAELQRFEVRFENGYDLAHDNRYNLWLKNYSQLAFNISPDSPEIPSPTPPFSPSSEHDFPTDSEPSSSSDDGYTPLQANKVLSGALKYPSPVSKQRPEVGEKVTARVLTSIDSLRAMEEKEK